MAVQFDNSYARLGSPLSAPQQPDPVKRPGLIRVNAPLASELGFDPQWLASDAGVRALAGNDPLPGSEPIATAYAGHQFGQFNPQLGDGRAVLLGEVISRAGRRYDVQLKGSGLTPWSRGGDGRSPLGPVLREYLVSEAMAALGVPTTRALAAVSSGEPVMRNGVEPGAILTRVASSHLRVGTAQYFAAREDRKSLALVVDQALSRHYPADNSQHDPQQGKTPNAALALLNGVIEAQATLIARWQLLGFVHGVMNTDNMLLCGETVDYGPCAFMEAFHPEMVFSSIDHQGRYAYCNQPGIAQWNITRLAESLLPLIDEDTDKAVELAKAAIQGFPAHFEAAHSAGLAAKLGLSTVAESDAALSEGLFSALSADKADFTLAFRFLADETCPGEAGTGAGALFEPGQKLLEWIPLWKQRQAQESDEPAVRQQQMFTVNPAFIPRNHLIQRAIELGEEGDYSLFHRLTERLEKPGHFDPEDRDLALPATPQERVLQTFCGT